MKVISFKKLASYLLLGLLILAFSLLAYAQESNPIQNIENQQYSAKLKTEDIHINIPDKVESNVVDLSGKLSKEEKTNISNKLNHFHNKYNKSDFVVLLTPGTNNENIEEFSNKVFRAWRLGTKKDNNGFLLVIDTNNRKYRTEVGYGYEGALPDGYLGRIGNDFLVPNLKDGNYYEAIYQYFTVIDNKLKNEHIKNNNTDLTSKEMLIICFGIIIVFVILSLIFGVEFAFFIIRIIILIISGGKINIGGGGSSGGGGNSGRF